MELTKPSQGAFLSILKLLVSGFRQLFPACTGRGGAEFFLSPIPQIIHTGDEKEHDGRLCVVYPSSGEDREFRIHISDVLTPLQ